jgi:hypothetical protein
VVAIGSILTLRFIRARFEFAVNFFAKYLVWFPFKREILLPLIMTEPTEYEMLLSDVAATLIDIDEVKEMLHNLQHDLRTARKALLKYKFLSVVHVSNKLERIEN